eukprot:1373797-Alexandrium_andersonii.AAC.1
MTVWTASLRSTERVRRRGLPSTAWVAVSNACARNALLQGVRKEVHNKACRNHSAYRARSALGD